MRYARVRKDLPPFKKNTIVVIAEDRKVFFNIMHHQQIGRYYPCRPWEVEAVDDIREVFHETIPPVQLF